MKQVKIAIDPGKSGALAVRYTDGRITIEKFTDEQDMRDALQHVKDHAFIEGYRMVAVIEKVRASPQMGVTSAFSFGWNYGFWRGLLQANRIPFREVRPQEWEKGLITEKLQGPERKRALRQVAKERYPELESKITLDTADALLMLDNA